MVAGISAGIRRFASRQVSSEPPTARPMVANRSSFGTYTATSATGSPCRSSQHSAAEIGVELRHRRPPGVAVVDGSGGVEHPAQSRRIGRRVRPAVPDELVDSAQQVLVRLALEVEWGRPERRRVHPGPHLRRDHLAAVEVAGRRGPPAGRQLLPAPALTLEQVGEPVAAERRRRRAVALEPEPNPATRSPALADGDEVLLVQLGERAVIVRPHPRRPGPVVHEVIKHGAERVAAAAGELLRQRGRPVRAVDLEAVAEHRSDQLGRHRIEEAIPDRSQVRRPPPRRCSGRAPDPPPRPRPA